MKLLKWIFNIFITAHIRKHKRKMKKKAKAIAQVGKIPPAPPEPINQKTSANTQSTVSLKYKRSQKGIILNNERVKGESYQAYKTRRVHYNNLLHNQYKNKFQPNFHR